MCKKLEIVLDIAFVRRYPLDHTRDFKLSVLVTFNRENLRTTSSLGGGQYRKGNEVLMCGNGSHAKWGCFLWM